MKLLSVVALAFAFAIVSLPCAEARPENNPEKDDAQDPHQGDHGEPPVTTVASPTTVASNASEPVPTDPPADVVDPAKGVNPDSDGGVNTTLAPSEDTSSNAAPSSSEMGETTTTSEPVTKAPESLDSTIPPEDNTAEKTTEKVATTPAASTASPDPHVTELSCLTRLYSPETFHLLYFPVNDLFIMAWERCLTQVINMLETLPSDKKLISTTTTTITTSTTASTTTNRIGRDTYLNHWFRERVIGDF